MESTHDLIYQVHERMTVTYETTDLFHASMSSIHVSSEGSWEPDAFQAEPDSPPEAHVHMLWVCVMPFFGISNP